MAKTIVITGASSGIGKATALLFHQKGWNVVATMRNPQKENELKSDVSMRLIRLDVQDKNSIESAIKASIDAFGKVDVWLNNAGYGAFGPMEAGTDDQIRRQFDVNFFGVIDCLKAILPHLKANRSGTIINITSIGGLMTLPLFGIYNSSKFALEGLSEGLWFDLKPFGIAVKLVEPGAIATDFGGRSLDTFDTTNYPEYNTYKTTIMERFTKPEQTKGFASPKLVAEVIYKAATDGKDTLRYLVGQDAKMFWFMRRWFGYKVQMKQVKKFFNI